MRRLLFSFGILWLSVTASSLLAEDLTQAQFKKAMDAYLTDYLIDYVSDPKNSENLAKLSAAFLAHVGSAQDAAVQSEVDELLKNRVSVNPEGSPSLGDPAAKAVMIVFSDFQCPYCSILAKEFPDALKHFPKGLRLVYKSLPLSFHSNAESAARAAFAAGEQGKFWQMHDLLFEQQDSLGESTYFELAKKLGLNMEKFKTDMAGEKVKSMIARDKEAAKNAGISGTPTAVINGVVLPGARPLAELEAVIKRVLAE